VIRTTTLIPLVAVVLLPFSGCEREISEAPAVVPVRTEAAHSSSFTPALTLLGVVRASESIPVASQQRGTIHYPARFASGLQTGVRVTRGEWIADIKNEDLRSEQTQARLTMDGAAADYDRAQRSFREGVISSAELDSRRLRADVERERYKAASQRLATLRIIAPASGTLVVKKLYPGGSAVDASTLLAEITTAGPPMVESAVAASERAALRPGLAVMFTSHGTPPWQGAGHISEVASVVDENGTSRVVAVINRGEQTPPPGTGVEMSVQLPPRGSVVTVPEDALVAGADGPAVFIAANAEGSMNRFRVKRVTVTTGGRANGRVEITSGIHDGDRVVVSGAEALSDESLATDAGEKARS
jgi:multidrug efflux system membrane fusion protein